MAKGIPTNPIVKNQIMEDIRNKTMTATDAANKYNIPRGTIKNWMRNQGVAGSERNYLSQINALKKELDNAYRVIGKLTAETDRPKG